MASGKQESRADADETANAPGALFQHIAVCLDRSSLAETTLPHAIAVTAAFDARISLVHVLQPPADPESLANPLQWECARAEANAYLEAVGERTRAQLTSNAAAHLEEQLVEGDAVLQIRNWVEGNGVDLAILCTHGRGGATEWPLASTARKLLDALRCSLLLVPASAARHSPADGRYHRVLVPLDGSGWSESALPAAARIARAHGAELVLAHAVPPPELTRTGAMPFSADDLELERRVNERNERVAHEYLDHLRTSLSPTGLSVSVVLERGGNVCGELGRIIGHLKPDLIVLSSFGHSGPVDRSCGAVALHLLTHSSIPLLLLRPAPQISQHRTLSGHRTTASRLPTQAAP